VEFAPVVWWGAHSWRDVFVPSGQAGRAVYNFRGRVEVETSVPQPLLVYYYLEPDAVYAPLFAYSGGNPWATEIHARAFKQGSANRTYRRADSLDVESTPSAR